MIKLNKLYKTYLMGETTVNALNGVSLNIDAGDYVAIMGPSGSGKSTLMHIIGLLDVPSSGSYKLNKREISKLSEDELSTLRRKTVGFVFQQFNLLSRMTALENVALPTLYSKKNIDIQKANELLKIVGLSERTKHSPNKLSGGQQQRVAIARALINEPHIILADEPTGNLDSNSEKEIIGLLSELNKAGMTVIIVTHEEEIAEHANRIIRMRDGLIQSDERKKTFNVKQNSDIEKNGLKENWFFLQIKKGIQHFKQGFKTLNSNKVRTFLSMLGIMIGVGAVVTMLALGKGAQDSIEKELASLGSNLLVLRAGATRMPGGAMTETGSVTRLTLEDASAIKKQVPNVADASPSITGSVQVTYQNKNWNTQVMGVEPSYAKMRASEPTIGRFFTDEENTRRTRVAVIGKTVLRELFENNNPIGQIIKINKVSFSVIGVLPEKGATGFRDRDDTIIIPIITAMKRLLGKDYVSSIEIEATKADSIEQTQSDVMSLMSSRHKIPLSQKDSSFNIRNMADIRSALSASTKTMTVLLSIIAAISLIVGGIGIMNIMLVSVTERTREIGLRKAVGAKRSDILFQFLSESTTVSIIGGTFGIVLAWTSTILLAYFAGWTTSITIYSVILAFGFSALTGIVFGVYPAVKASKLNPIDALRYE